MNLLFYLMIQLFIAGCTGIDPELEKSNIEDNILDQNFVTLSEALKNADIAFSKIYGTTRSEGKTYESVDVFSPGNTRCGDKEIYGYYIVNYAENSGFAILSADKLFEILGRTGYLNADYGIYSTGASPIDIAPTFTRLGYSNATFANFSATTVNKSLKNSQPVLCGGQSNEGGHRWVIDGGVENRLVRYLNGSEVDTSLIYYYHCIWGWG